MYYEDDEPLRYVCASGPDPDPDVPPPDPTPESVPDEELPEESGPDPDTDAPPPS